MKLPFSTPTAVLEVGLEGDDLAAFKANAQREGVALTLVVSGGRFEATAPRAALEGFVTRHGYDPDAVI